MKNALAYAALLVAFAGGLTASAMEPHRNANGEFCADANELMHKANEVFHEKVTWTGTSSAGYRYVLMTSDKSWSFIMVDNTPPGADGSVEACLKASDGVPASERKDL